MRHALTVLLVLWVYAAGAAGQDLIRNNGFDEPFIRADTTNQPGSNTAWEWLGATDWWLYGWPDGDAQGRKYYNGQYGPYKAPRDFTGRATDAWSPVPGGTPGLVRAHLLDTLVFAPGEFKGVPIVSREPKAGDPSDHFIRFQHLASQLHYVSTQVVPAGTRLLVKLDYISPSVSQKIELFGMLNHNLARTPYFSWDTAGGAWNPLKPDGPVNLGDVVHPGPDIALSWGAGTKWNGHSNSGQCFGTGYLPPSAEWTTGQCGFTVQLPALERTGEPTKVLFDYIGLEFYASRSTADVHGIDNLHVYVLPPADATEDGRVDLEDLAVFATNWGKAAGMDWTDGDFTGDGAVDLADLAILATHWSATAPHVANGPAGGSFADALAAVGLPAVPEPATLWVVTAAACVGLRRRA